MSEGNAMDTQLVQAIEMRTVTLTHDRGEHHGAEHHTFKVAVQVAGTTIYTLSTPRSFDTYDGAERTAHVRAVEAFVERPQKALL